MRFLFLKIFLLAMFCVHAGVLPAHATQGQWGGFIYLFEKKSDDAARWKESLIKAVQRASLEFQNDFTPQSSLETIHFIRTQRYTLKGEPRSPKPLGVIRVESMDRNKIRNFYNTVQQAASNGLDLRILYGVTAELRYTDAETLERLRKNAPKRGPGGEQPNAVVFPLSKTGEWWTQTQEQREAYFFQHPDRFGEKQLGHNAIGFRYIQKIYRKLYQSRFIDGNVDFITYFEYADGDREAFDRLLGGLRDTALNPEWKFVKEEPIVYGTRVESLEQLLR